MWKITKVKFNNFIHLYSGMGKYDIELDLSASRNKINVIIGKMGSGKSAILAHLQPFANVGSLDSRNRDSIVIPKKSGYKEISFLNGTREIDIKHIYTWNDRTETHNVKSYISINGEELNENGNTSSFKEIVRSEFGIEQNFLRLLRLGPMVGNLINMSSADRKVFIGSLIEDTEVYSIIHKKLNDDYRKINSHITILSNKLSFLDADKEDIYNSDIINIKSEMDNITKDINEKTALLNSSKGEIKALMNGFSSISEIENHLADIKNHITVLTDKISELENLQKKLEGFNIPDLNIKLGESRSLKNQLIESINTVDKDNTEIQIEINKLNDIIQISGTQERLDILLEAYVDIEDKYNRYSLLYDKSLPVNYSYQQLSVFIGNLPDVMIMIDNLSMNTAEDLSFVSRKTNIAQFVSKKIGMLNGKKYNLQQNINNIKFANTYSNTIIPITPPFCPAVDTCPYKVTHPHTIKLDIKDRDDRKLEIESINNSIAAIDVEISKYEEYPLMQRTLYQLLSTWSHISKILIDLKCIGPSTNMMTILTEPSIRNQWYDRDKLMTTLEKYKVREEFQEVSNQYFITKSEIEKIQSTDLINAQKTIEELSMKLCAGKEKLSSLKISLEDTNAEIVDIHKTIEDVYKTTSRIEECNDILLSMNTYNLEVEKYTDILDRVLPQASQLATLEDEIGIINTDYKALSERYEEVFMRLKDIAYTKAEYSTLLEDKTIIKHIMSAVSPKNGIPLIMIKRFLDSCRENINDLICDVFDDALEILDFDIDMESAEFKIPYMINGNIVEDISMASQGQQSIISIALSFALVKESIFDYNIMLLDEVDGPLYKKDREKFITILFKQMSAIESDQVFFCSHNNTFEGTPTNVLLTTPEVVDSKINSIFELY